MVAKKILDAGFVIPAKSACGGREPGSRQRPREGWEPETKRRHWTFTGFPFNFAQDREPVERPVDPRISSGMTGSEDCDNISRGEEIFAELS